MPCGPKPLGYCYLVLDNFVVVDYQEGAGGEFLASFISAHWGHPLIEDPQKSPNQLQKWLNSYSLIWPDWNENFSQYLKGFVDQCRHHDVKNIAVPYHLYKWPHHIDIIKDLVSTVRFVKINSTGNEAKIDYDFRRKVLNRSLGIEDLYEIQFLLSTQNPEQKIRCMQLFKKGTLTIGDMLPPVDFSPRLLPSQDVEIVYQNFFIDFDQTSAAYQKLCQEIDLPFNNELLCALINRNKKNLQQ
jgi:hypothetical protein